MTMPSDQSNNHCQECGMLLNDPGEYHPHIFCVLKKAGRDPWLDVVFLASTLGLKPKLGKRPPLVRNLGFPDR